MSKSANPSVIGAFVLGGIALLTALVLIIAGDSLTKDSQRFVVYFENSIKGLKVGSNVMFRGVPIGYVSEIDVVLDPNTLNVTVPVYVDIIRQVSGDREVDEDALDELIGRGLRASLQSESLITGQLYIELDFYPDAEAVYRGKDDEVPEIPSIQSGIQAVVEQAQRFVSDIQSELDPKEVARELREILNGINTVVNNEATQELPASATAALNSLDAAAGTIEQVFANLEQGSAEVVPEVLGALDKVQSILESLDNSIREDSEVAYRINATLKEVEGAARSIRVLADYIEQHPEALLQGKKDQGAQDTNTQKQD